jgi:phenylpropionate dioxygenase-like ring-hydroxylating dioxygenase large terminal subunit
MTDLFERMRQTCAITDPAHATTLPADAYASAELYALEREKIMLAGWQPVCRAEQLKEPGSYYSIDLLGRPLVVTRDRSGELHVLSRTCLHRWMEVASGAGQAGTLQCPYHLWTYGLDGQLVGAPQMDDVPGFDKKSLCLPHIRHEVWHGFVFVNLDGTAPPLAPQLAGLDSYLANYDIDGYGTVETTEWTCPWDWKIMVENFMECYHHIGPHRTTLEDEYPAAMSWTDVGGDLFSIMHIQQDTKYDVRSPFQRPGSPSLRPEQLTEILIFTVYPHFMVSLGPGFMYWMKVLPEGPGQISLHLDICMSGAALADPARDDLGRDLIDGIIKIHKEDLDICAGVQRAVNSGAVTSVGRLALLEQPLWEFHRYIGRQIGIIGADEPVLGDANVPLASVSSYSASS